MRYLQWHPPLTPPNSVINVNQYAQKTYRHRNIMHTPSDPPAAAPRNKPIHNVSPALFAVRARALVRDVRDAWFNL